MNTAITQIVNISNFWVEFLELYKSLPALWKNKSEKYGNRKIREESYNKMVEKLQEIDPTANREKVVRKINTFRTNYRREVRHANSVNRRLGSGQIYKSSLWYFDMLSFINYQDKSLTSENTNSLILRKKKKILKVLNKETDDETLVKKRCDHLNEINDKTNKIDYENQKKKTLKKVIKQTDDETLVKRRCDNLNEINNKTIKIDYENQKNKIVSETETLGKERCDNLNKINNKTNKIDYENQKEDNDEATIFGKGWATQYAQLSNKQKLLSRKIISDVLFHGSLNHLTENSVHKINNILDSPNWNNDYNMESEEKIQMEDYCMESEVKIEMEDYIE